MDDVLNKALKRQRILLIELGELNRFIETYRRLSRTEPEDAKSDLDVNTEDNSRAVTKPRGFPAKFVRIIEGVLKDVDRPLNRAQLVAEIEGRNILIPGQDKAKYIGTLIWRERRLFVHLDGHGYWLRQVPMPGIGYDPADYSDIEHQSANLKIADVETRDLLS